MKENRHLSWKILRNSRSPLSVKRAMVNEEIVAIRGEGN
jgi:hypothetical protein